MNTKKIILSLIAIILVLTIIIIVSVHSRKIMLQGEVECQTVNVSAKVPGRIEEISIHKGDWVKKGDKLIILDLPDIKAKLEQTNAVLDAALAQNEKAISGTRNEQVLMGYNSLKQAQAGLELAEKTYKRLKNLHDEGVISAQKLDEANAAYNNAKGAFSVAQANYNMLLNGTRKEDKLSAVANVKRAQGAVDEVNSYLDEMVLIAPIEGEITEISAEQGELIGSGYPVITIANINDVWVTFNLREDLLSKIKMGSTFKAKFPALNNKEIELKVNYISVLGNFATWKATKAKGDFDLKTFEVRAIPTEKTEGLRSGMSAIVDWNSIK